jgi:hypothetical protein
MGTIFTASLILMQGDIISQFYEYFGWLVWGLGYIIDFFKIILIPIGEFLATLVEELSIFVIDMDLFYWVAAAVIIVCALIINMKWAYRTKKTKIKESEK